MATEKRLIDASALKRHMLAFMTACGTTYMNASEIVAAIAKVPTMDAVEVVRCKDCKHREDGRCPMEQFYPWLDQRDTDFCSYGERRTDA